MKPIKCPNCGKRAYKTDEYGGKLNHKRHPVVKVYSCPDCGIDFERLTDGTVQMLDLVDCVDFINDRN
jgi:DNA-directed RNA polymerase subunit RPC12/RpoP